LKTRVVVGRGDCVVLCCFNASLHADGKEEGGSGSDSEESDSADHLAPMQFPTAGKPSPTANTLCTTTQFQLFPSSWKFRNSLWRKLASLYKNCQLALLIDSFSLSMY
jgi:hypothetical protein